MFSPVAGHVLAVSDIPDPVFAKGMVGPGRAIAPLPGRQVAVAPMAGTLVKLHPHAFVVHDRALGKAVLVHLGVDTVHMQGEGFELLVGEGVHVEPGDAIVSWDPAVVEAAGHSPICAVVVLDCDPDTVLKHRVDLDVAKEDLLLEVVDQPAG